MMRRHLLRQLAAFHAVGVEGSISAAAGRLGKSPPAVHHDLAALEQSIGAKLFSKSGRYLRLTPASRQLHVEVGRALDKLERELDRISRSSAEESVWRIGAVAGFGRYRLAPLLFARAGNRRVELTTGAHEDVISSLLEGAVELGITYRPVVASSVECEFLASEEIVLIGGSPLRPADLSLAAVSELQFVTYDEYEYVFGTWFNAVFGAQPKQLRRRDHSTELEEALESVASGRGVSIVPADAWRWGPWRGRCAELLPAAPRVVNQLFLLSLPGESADQRQAIRAMFKDAAP